jgi:hypothetical protein
MYTVQKVYDMKEEREPSPLCIIGIISIRYFAQGSGQSYLKNSIQTGTTHAK